LRSIKPACGSRRQNVTQATKPAQIRANQPPTPKTFIDFKARLGLGILAGLIKFPARRGKRGRELDGLRMDQRQRDHA
jgi:hypothetical protein